MPRALRIAVAQIDPIVGDFEGNIRKILQTYERACAEQARLLLTPELSVCGYPPHDLIERPEMIERNEAALERLAAATRGKGCVLAVGHIARNPEAAGRGSQNVVTLLENGVRVFSQAKTLLPTYDVFDEARYFEPAKEVKLWECDGRRIALAICEDLWANDASWGRSLYGVDPAESYRTLGAEIVLSIAASPYEFDKSTRRESLHAAVAARLGVPLIYLNQTGATDEILFDGGSFALDHKGAMLGRLPAFRSGVAILEWEGGALQWVSGAPSADGLMPAAAASEISVLADGLITGIREYFRRTGFRTAILGLSGGIDSAVIAVLAARALGPQNVLGVAMPSQYSSGHSLEDAELLAKNLGIAFEVRPIKFLFATASRELAEGRGALAPLAQENLQSRLRGNILMTLANHYNALVLTTGNKSELAMGYCTLYGDMCGALAPIGDLFKTRVYELARQLNSDAAARVGSVAPIPERSITKAPSAELRPDQKDQDTLPPYELLDALLSGYVEELTSVAELELRFGNDPAFAPPRNVRETLRRVEINEYKRRQGAPVLKISRKAFGIGRRIPISKRWDA